MSHSNTHWIALAAIAVSLVLLVPVVVGQPAPGAATHGDTPISGWAGHVHEWMSDDTTDYRAGGGHHGGQNHHASGPQRGDGVHHAGHLHGPVGQHHTTDTGHYHQGLVGNGTQSGDGHYLVNGSGDRTTTSDQTDRRGSWEGCH